MALATQDRIVYQLVSRAPDGRVGSTSRSPFVEALLGRSRSGVPGAGVIALVDSRGDVELHRYDTSEALDAAWHEAERRLGGALGAARRLERSERPFDPTAARESYARPHHFAVNSGSRRYRVLFRHKISPRDTDTAVVELPDAAFSDKKKLAKALREAPLSERKVGDLTVLPSGGTLREFRVEGDRVVAFPGGRSVWHAFVLTPLDEHTVTAEEFDAGMQREADRLGPHQRNPRGLYAGHDMTSGDVVVYLDHRGRWRADLITTGGGNHITLGSTRGEASQADAIRLAEQEHHRRGHSHGVVFELRGDDYSQIGNIVDSVYRESGTQRRVSELAQNHHHSLVGGLADDRETLDQLVQMAAESTEMSDPSEARATDAVVAEARRFDEAASRALDEVVVKYPPLGGAGADALWDAHGSYAILMTLRGEGVGIWDYWVEAGLYDDTEPVEALLRERLGSFANVSGSGSLNEALYEAAYETGGESSYEGNARGVVGSSDQSNALIAIGKQHPQPVVFFNAWTTASSLIRRGLVKKSPAPRSAPINTAVFEAFYGPSHRPGDAYANRAYYSLTPQGVEAYERLRGPRHAENARGEADSQAANELRLYIDNDPRFSPDSPSGQGRDIVLNLMRKRARGVFDAELSVKLWGYLVQSAAKAYAQEFDSPGGWSRMFNVPTRELVARELATDFAERAAGGEYDHLDLRTRR